MRLSSFPLKCSLLAVGAVLSCSSVLALQPRPARIYNLESVKWHVWLHPSTSSLDGYVINTVKPFKAGTKTLYFDCGKMKIGKVTINDIPVKYHWDPSEMLYVTVPKQFQKVMDLHVLISYNVRPTAGAYFIPASRAYPAHTSVFYTQGECQDNHCWLPTYDYPNDKALTEGWINVPAGWKALSNGALEDVKKEGLRETWHWKMNKPISTYLISFVAGRYDIGYEKLGNLSVQYWTPQGLLSWGKAAFGNTGRIIALYEKLTGFQYPWPKFAQSAVPDFMFGGMENASCVTQTISALFPPSAAPLEDSSGLVAHELAHQWFGDTVTTKDWANAWLNEGFATFMPWFLVRQEQGEDAFEVEKYSNFKLALLADQMQKRPVVYSDYSQPMDQFGLFIYQGGGSRLAMLMQKLGESAFWKGINYYLTKEEFKPVDTPTFFADMSKSTGVNLTPFMKYWFYGSDMPSVTAKVDGGKLVLTQKAPYADLPMPVWIWDNGAWVKKSFDLSSGSATFDLGSMANDPILLDPHKAELANETTDWTYTNDQWLTVFNNAPVVSQVAMLGGGNQFFGGGNTGPNLSQDQWKQLLQTISAPQVQPLLINKLDKDSLSTLMTYVTGSDVKLQRDAINRISALYSSDAPSDVLASLRSLIDTSSNPDIRNAAYDALMHMNGSEALANLGWHTDSFRENMETTALNWWADHSKSEARAYALQALYSGMMEPVRIAAINVLGRVGDAKGEHTAYDALIKVVQEGSFGATNAAMNALASLGDVKAIPYIKPLTHSDMLFIRRTAKSALSRLSSDAEAMRKGSNG